MNKLEPCSKLFKVSISESKALRYHIRAKTAKEAEALISDDTDNGELVDEDIYDRAIVDVEEVK